MMKIILIVAESQNGVIGNNGKLPWTLKSDLEHFKKQTQNHTILMGRKCYDSIGRKLPNRTNIILTKNKDLKIDGCEVFTSLENAIEFCKSKNQEKLFIIGGAEIYTQSLKFCDEIIHTRVLSDVSGNVFMPKIDGSDWKLKSFAHYDKNIGEMWLNACDNCE